ncbi:hypothetical protein DM02DRAFT_614021 [Periconia macrospinosa]|uniref:Methyltransferase domain-containing protein n=1 Tax=Periconia macrospinosa TaxID=97972 RepID=A0A2V1DRR1_9PLEO|nr:hypothetical protein DM02DRAFT_614021 [Periconia macrospinosa]
MGPDTPLPLPAEFSSVDDYVESLLAFTTSSWMLQTLCGGVHILDFYTRSPDLYSSILPESWRNWFKVRDIMDILDLLMREDLTQFGGENVANTAAWRGGPAPPEDLLKYVRDVRKHLLGREFVPPAADQKKPNISRHVAIGMKVKKVHEVENFARYVDRLTADIAATGKEPITHLIDFGSGQNYLGRALAAPPFSKHLVAVESKPHNIEGAKDMDIKARLAPKPVVMRNKKEYRAKTGKVKKSRLNPAQSAAASDPAPDVAGSVPEITSNDSPNHQEDTEPDALRGAESFLEPKPDPKLELKSEPTPAEIPQSAAEPNCNDDECIPASNSESNITTTEASKTSTTHLQIYTEGHGSVQYVEHIIKDGDLKPVIDQVLDTSQVEQHSPSTSTSILEPTPSTLQTAPKPPTVNAMVISLHSCGNLVHHGLRSLILNPSVSAVAMVGCCYNLLTERLGPPTYKLPTLRTNHPRLESTSNAYDPHGFPMSQKFENYPLPYPPSSDPAETPQPRGIRLNITARMMAVQAPYNWGREDSELFFTRHFYRALLQRIFLDRGVVSAPSATTTFPPSTNPMTDNPEAGVSAAGHTSHVLWPPPPISSTTRGPGLSSSGKTTPLTIGTLRKFAYSDFKSYVRAALAKLTSPNTFCEVDPGFIREKMEGLGDEEVERYEREWAEKKHELSVMWALMAFSAGVVEAVVVVDRWVWLREQEGVGEAWVEAVFGYGYSPRNLVVVGVKR